MPAKKSIDKTINDAYVWYSGATNVTGEKLAEALGMKHGRTKPTLSKTSLVLGWGAKTKDAAKLGKVIALNHPDHIRTNRNKLSALDLMKNAGVNVAPFCVKTDAKTMKSSGVVLPVIGRTKYHQGGKGFWNCPTMTHVKEAIDAGAAYFQNLIEIKNEYRLHIVGDDCIYAVKKVKRSVEEMEEAFVKHEMDRQTQLAEKNGNPFDKDTAELLLKRQAKKFAQDGANMLIRSNRLGWRFSRIKSPNKDLIEEAVKACKSLNLDFGAVDCCTDADGKHWIIEVNTGPGLEDTPFKAWVKALNKMIEDKLGSKDAKKTKGAKSSSKKTANESKESGVKKAASTKSSLADKLSLAQEMVEVANDEEAETLNKVFGKMFGGQ